MPLRIGILGAAGTGKTTLRNQLATALSAHGADVVISEFASLPEAPDRPTGNVIYLLMGLDLPGPLSRENEDAHQRSLLRTADLAYRVIYGHGAARLASALRAVDERLNPNRQGEAPTEPWIWTCEKCSDPVCEHRLFSRLTAQTSAS